MELESQNLANAASGSGVSHWGHGGFRIVCVNGSEGPDMIGSPPRLPWS